MLNIYPVEQSFKFPLILTALLVLLPALALYWFYGDSSVVPRAFKLFIGNWISPIILWFFSASFLHLLLKKTKLQKEKKQSAFLTERILPTIIRNASTDPTNNTLHDELSKSTSQNHINRENLLSTRLDLFLNHHDDDVDEIFSFKERELMRSSFSLSRFMVWAIPIMGFIGTVWGISNGIAHFSDAMTTSNSVTDVSAMLKESLPLVTNSLATAFDTTLLALLLSIPLMMLMISLEKTEESYLIDLDERWFHDIKPDLQSHFGKTTSTSSQGQTVISGGGDSAASTQIVANEIQLLSSQIKALQETMEDLYETVFTSNLGDGK
jgi:biopolymer transport protein ExbB/TolQ